MLEYLAESKIDTLSLFVTGNTICEIEDQNGCGYEKTSIILYYFCEILNNCSLVRVLVSTTDDNMTNDVITITRL